MKYSESGRFRIVLTVTGLVCLAAAIYLEHQRTQPTCAVIHRPSTGCPNGFVQEKTPRFTEPDHSKEFACVALDAHLPVCIDQLKPGESMTMELRIEK